MRDLKIIRNEQEQPIQRCPFHCGLVGFAKIGSPFCVKECEHFKDINPMTDQVTCSCQGRYFEEGE